MQRPSRLSIITPSSKQAPFIEYNAKSQRWRVWQSFNPTVTAGTYLDLYPSGAVERVTLGPDGSIKDITTVVSGDTLCSSLQNKS